MAMYYGTKRKKFSFVLSRNALSFLLYSEFSVLGQYTGTSFFQSCSLGPDGYQETLCKEMILERSKTAVGKLP